MNRTHTLKGRPAAGDGLMLRNGDGAAERQSGIIYQISFAIYQLPAGFSIAKKTGAPAGYTPSPVR